MTVSPDPNHEIILVPSVGQPGREQLRQESYNVRINVFRHEQALDEKIDELRVRRPSRRPLP